MSKKIWIKTCKNCGCDTYGEASKCCGCAKDLTDYISQWVCPSCNTVNHKDNGKCRCGL
jgi:hypothetical protein